MTVQYVASRVKGISIPCIAYCQRCNRAYACGSRKDVEKVVRVMHISAFLREKPKQRHVCPRCKDELVAAFLARCGSQRERISEELLIIRSAPADHGGGL